MKHLKYFENSEDGRKEIWEIDDQVSHLINNDTYILIMLKKIGMDDNSVKHFINYQLSGVKREMEKCKEYNREFYLYIEKVYNTSYTLGYTYFPIIRSKKWYNIQYEADHMGHIKVEDYELQTIKYNL